MKYVNKDIVDNLSSDANTVMTEIRSVFPGPAPEPMLLHAFEPQLLEGYWRISKAAYFSGAYSRHNKDIIAAGVSAANACSYCLEPHSDLIALNYKGTAKAIGSDKAEQIPDLEQRALYAWSRNTTSRAGNYLSLPAFDTHRAEIVAVALLFHYTNRLANVFLDDSPLKLPRIPGLKWVSKKMAQSVLRKLASETTSPPEVTMVSKNDQFDWAQDNSVIHSNFSFFDRLVEQAGVSVLTESTRQSIESVVRAWGGETMPLDRSWLDVVMSNFPADEKASARLSLLVALDSNRVTELDVQAYQGQSIDDSSLLKLAIWSSFLTTKRIGSWC